MPAAASNSGAMQRVQPATAANPSTSSTNTSTTSRGGGGGGGGLGQDWNAEELQKVVLEYLTKKGFHKAETMLRLEASQMQEAAHVGEGYRKLTDPFFGTTSDAYQLLREFIQESLDMYKVE